MTSIQMLVDQQIKRWEFEKRIRLAESQAEPKKPGIVITISRQRGSGGSLVAGNLRELTGFSLVNREIIDQISKEIGTQKRLIESLDEKVRSDFESWFDGMLHGRIIDTSDYFRSLVKVIGAITHHGQTIIVGRGANFVVGNKNAFNVRIVADRDFRVESLMKRRSLGRKEAEAEINRNDEQRRKFIRTHFDRDIDDPASYDMIINSTCFGIDKIAVLILNAYPQKDYAR